MKFLLIQENGRHAANRHMRECFSMQRALTAAGHECVVWGLGHENFTSPPDFETFDVIINLENYDTGWVPSMANVRKPIKLLWAIDAHFQGVGYYNEIFRKGKYRKILQATKTYEDMDNIWFPNCYDAEFIKPLPDIAKKELVGFCGNYVNRKPLFDALQFHIPRFQLAVGVLGHSMVETINSWHIHFNANVNGDINYRSFETLGCKTALLTNFDYQYELLGFKHGVNCLMYKSIPEAVSLIQHYEDKLEDLAVIAQAGYELVTSQHTYNKRADDLLQIISSLQSH